MEDRGRRRTGQAGRQAGIEDMRRIHGTSRQTSRCWAGSCIAWTVHAAESLVCWKKTKSGKRRMTVYLETQRLTMLQEDERKKKKRKNDCLPVTRKRLKA